VEALCEGNEIEIGRTHISKYYSRMGHPIPVNNLYVDGNPCGKFSFDFSIYMPPHGKVSIILSRQGIPGLYFRVPYDY
jgi:hypothetical protein